VPLLRDAMEIDVVANLVDAEIEFVIVGGAAARHYGSPRPQDDLDILVNPSRANVVALRVALHGLKPPFLLTDDNIEQLATSARPIQIKLPQHPYVEILTGIDSVKFADVFADATMLDAAGLCIRVISKEHLLACKRVRGAPKDREDIEFLESI
jgi:hypothetical protein